MKLVANIISIYKNLQKMTLDLFSNDENRVDLEIERTLNNTTKLFISKITR